MIDNPREYKNQLLAKLDAKQLTHEQLQTECAYWYMDCFPEISPRPYPTTPMRYQEYLDMSFAERKTVPKEFWQLPEVKLYLDQKYEVLNENKSKLYWLVFYKEQIPKEDFESRAKFQEKINEFRHAEFS